MNAKITYTIDLSKTPEEVAKLLRGVAERATALSQALVSASSAAHAGEFEALSQITSARESLVLLDANLDDCYSVLLGYFKHAVEKKLPPPPPKQNP